MASIKKNYILNLSYQIFSMIAPLITAPYISRVLGADGVGIYSYADSIAAYFVIFATCGTSAYGQRGVSYLQDDKAARTELFWNVAFFRIISTSIFLTAYLILCGFQDNPIIFGLLAINVLSVAFDFTWLFQGMEDFRSIVIRNFALRIMSIVLIFVIVHNHDDLLLYIIALVLPPILCNIALWPLLPKYISRPSFSNLRPFSDFKTIISLFIPSIAISIYTTLDKTMIGLITVDSLQNGYYEQAIKISRMALTIVTSLGTVMVPRIGHLFAANQHDQVREYMYRSYRFVWLVGIPICLGLIAVAPNMVPWFFGEEFIPAILPMQVLSLLTLAIGINNVTGIQYLIPTGRQNVFTATVTIGAICNFAMNLILIPQIGAVGAAIASVSAETIIAIVQIIYVRKELKASVIAKSSVRYALAGLAMFASLFGLNLLIAPSIPSTILLIATGSVIYFVLLLLLRDEFLRSTVEKLRLQRKKNQ